MLEYHIVVIEKDRYSSFSSPKKIIDIILSEEDYKIIKDLIMSSDLTKTKAVEMPSTVPLIRKS